MTKKKGQRTKRIAWSAPSLAALAWLALAAGLGLAAGVPPPPEELPLPPPPLDVARPAAPAAGAAMPEVLFSDEATAKDLVRDTGLPAVPLQMAKIDPAPGVKAAAAAVDQMLVAISQEAPKNATLESMLFEQLRAVMPQGSEGYIFERIMLPTLSNLPPQGWRVRYDFRLPARGIGQAPFSASIIGANERVLRTFSGSVAIDREAGGVQVTHVIHRGEPVAGGDCQMLGTRLSQLPAGALDRINATQEMVARQELRPGQWLTDQMVQVPQIIKQSQPVTMLVQRGPIRIIAPGIARQGGAQGEVIRVENIQSQRVIYARVLSHDEVQVVF